MGLVNILIFSKVLLCIEVCVQLVVVATEAVSNSEYKKFPPSAIMIGYTGQSLLVIIVAILLNIMTVLVYRNLGRVLATAAWKIGLSCVGFSLASIAFRSFSSGFVVNEPSIYYLASYNITSYFIAIGTAIWIPFGFCKSDKYIPETIVYPESHRIRTTNGRQRMTTHRPHQDEDTLFADDGTREQLPSYFEMMRPPSYKNTMPETPSNNDSSPSNDSNNSLPPPIDETNNRVILNNLPTN